MENNVVHSFGSLSEEWIISFELMITELHDGTFNIIRVGDSSGSRIALIFLTKQSSALEVRVAIEAKDDDYYIGVSEKTNPIPLNTWTEISLFVQEEQDGSYAFYVLVDNAMAISAPIWEPKIHSNVNIYASDNLMTAAHARIRNIEVDHSPIDPYSVNLDMGTCNNGAWSTWKNRDDPGKTYDSETIEDFATDYNDEFQGTDLCANPIAAQSRILGTTDMSTTEDVQFSSNGLKCENTVQTNGKCSDYEVRFCCAQKGNYKTNNHFLLRSFIFISFDL